MDIKEYYDEIARENKRLVRDLLARKHAGQPEPEMVADEYGDAEKRPTAVYLTSVRNRDRNTTAGHVCLAFIWDAKGNPGLAATRIAEGTHRVSTAEEIDAYLKRQQDQRRYHEQQDLKFDGRAKQFRVSLPE
ncbi:MAG: hypothetical protein ABSH56_14730 [Bryobacteraceae bacterium]|jgi:hypothetical protein